MKYKSNRVIVSSFILVMLMVISCFIIACQKTPEELVVKSKAGNEMDKLIKATPIPNDELAEQVETQAIQQVEDEKVSLTKVLKHVVASKSNDNDTITINIDADVVVPTVDKIPTALVCKGEFTQVQVDAILNALFGDAELYELDRPLTKSQIEEEIIKLKKASTDLESDMAQSEEITSLEELKKRGDELIAEYEKIYQDAPDDMQNFVANTDINDVRIHPRTGEEMTGLQMRGDLGRKEDAVFYLHEWEHGDIMEFENFNNRMSRQGYSREPISLGKIAEDEDANRAYQLAISKKDEMKLDDFVVSNMSIASFNKNVYGDNVAVDKQKYYVISFERVINGVKVSNAFHNIRYTDENEYSKRYEYESLNMWLDDTGIVRFGWSSPYEIKEIINDNVDVKYDVDYATDAILKQLFIEYADMHHGKAKKIVIDINSVKLDLARIKYKDHNGEHILVPVWDFYGKVKVEFDDSCLDDMHKSKYDMIYPKEDGMYIINTPPHQSVAIVNSLDGTIVNRDYGY